MSPPLGKRGAPIQEDASQLILGEEFDEAGCLMVSEVEFLLDKNKTQKTGEDDSSVYQKTRAHVDVFAKMSLDEVRTIRGILTREKDLIKPFELAQLGNIMPDTADMAKSLIPSLSRLDDEKLQGLLDELAVTRRAERE